MKGWCPSFRALSLFWHARDAPRAEIRTGRMPPTRQLDAPSHAPPLQRVGQAGRACPARILFDGPHWKNVTQKKKKKKKNVAAAGGEREHASRVSLAEQCRTRTGRNLGPMASPHVRPGEGGGNGGRAGHARAQGEREMGRRRGGRRPLSLLPCCLSPSFAPPASPI